MSQSALVLGVPHQLQGRGFAGYVEDEPFSSWIEGLIGKVDFVFEEAQGLGPSVAEELAKPGRYRDVDPSWKERPKYKISQLPVRSVEADPSNPGDRCDRSITATQEKREKLWVERIRGTGFTKALVIVGIAHCLSVAFRLESAGIAVPEAYSYTPWDKLCQRKHNQ